MDKLIRKMTPDAQIFVNLDPLKLTLSQCLYREANSKLGTGFGTQKVRRIYHNFYDLPARVAAPEDPEECIKRMLNDKRLKGKHVYLYYNNLERGIEHNAKILIQNKVVPPTRTESYALGYSYLISKLGTILPITEHYGLIISDAIAPDIKKHDLRQWTDHLLYVRYVFVSEPDRFEVNVIHKESLI